MAKLDELTRTLQAFAARVRDKCEKPCSPHGACSCREWALERSKERQ